MDFTDAPADERYDFTVETVLRNASLWGLRDHDGWVMFADDAARCFPIWPDPDSAALAATADWSGCTPSMVTLDDFTRDWLPGLGEDGVLIAVYPNASDEAVILAAEDFAAVLDAADSGPPP